MSDLHVRLGLRADTLHEVLLDALSRRIGAYDRAGVDVVAVPRSVETINVGLVSCLLEAAHGARAWRVVLVSSIAPLFWEVPAAGAGPHVPAHGTAVEALRCLARNGPATPSLDRVVVGPTAAADVATGRIDDVLDVGGLARFPALGLAVLPGCPPEVTHRMVQAHHEALVALKHDDAAVADVLRERGVSDADAVAVTGLLRRRLRRVPLVAAADHAGRGARLLGLPEQAVRNAFVP